MGLLELQEALGAAPDSAFRLKIAKGLVLDDLKWARWPTMLSVTLPMAKKHSKEPDRWFSQQMCLTLQRIVKSIGVDKAQESKFQLGCRIKKQTASAVEQNDVRINPVAMCLSTL